MQLQASFAARSNIGVPLRSWSHPREVFQVAIPRLCKFYRDFCKLHADSGSVEIVQDTGYCDLDCDQTTCEGGLDSCQKSDMLKRYYFEQIRRGGGLEWEKRRSPSFFENFKI
jgi:hypothetical protein